MPNDSYNIEDNVALAETTIAYNRALSMYEREREESRRLKTELYEAHRTIQTLKDDLATLLKRHVAAIKQGAKDGTSG